MAEGKKLRTVIKASKAAARNPRWTTVFLLVGIVISIGVAVAVGYLFDSQRVVWTIRVIVILLAVVFLYLLIRLGYRYEWTGFGQADLPKPEDREVRPKKTVWDWLQLLIVPVVLALVTVAFTLYQDSRQTRIEQQRAESALKVEEKRAQDAALQDYLDQMGSLLLDKDRPLRQSKEGAEVRTLARARTLTVLERMDASRKSEVIQFLDEAHLLRDIEERQPIITLYGANLSGADTRGADLRGAELSGADLSGADLSDVKWQTRFDDANLRGADLSSADLSGANLSGANLSGAELSGANLNDADLSGANLESAREVTKEQLEEQANSLEGTTMPDGSKHP